MAGIVLVDFDESLHVLSEGLCDGLEVLRLVDAIDPEAFVCFCCEESNVPWGHAVMMEEGWIVCHGLRAVHKICCG